VSSVDVTLPNVKGSKVLISPDGLIVENLNELSRAWKLILNPNSAGLEVDAADARVGGTAPNESGFSVVVVGDDGMLTDFDVSVLIGFKAK
jgi:hypothetical protein